MRASLAPLTGPERQPKSFALPSDERIRPHIHQRIPPLEHSAQGGHHPPGGIDGPSWFNFPLLEQRQLPPKEEVFGGQRSVERAARKASRTRSNTTKDNVRKQCATARKTDERDMNVQDCTLQSVTGARFRLERSFCGAQEYCSTFVSVRRGFGYAHGSTTDGMSKRSSSWTLLGRAIGQLSRSEHANGL